MSWSLPGGKVVLGRGKSIYEKLWHPERTWPSGGCPGLHAVHVQLVGLVLGDNGTNKICMISPEMQTPSACGFFRMLCTGTLPAALGT